MLILAAGYGTRLARDLATSNEYSHLIGCPKPLLPVAGKPLINYWMEMLASRVKQTDVYIIVSSLVNQTLSSGVALINWSYISNRCKRHP